MKFEDWFLLASVIAVLIAILSGCTCGPYYAEDRIYDQDLRFPQRAAWVHIEGQCKVAL